MLHEMTMTGSNII